ncbi:MAG: PBP1A family penicillin-binding protein [bacterium]|nr:PBP1A family penicillin-binding protein [bacterium]
MQRLNHVKPRHVLRALMYATAGIAVVVLVFVAFVLSDGLPTLEQLENPKQDLATQVFSADGVLLEHFATTRRTYTPFDSIPTTFVKALIATEDRAFYDHWGVHTMRIVKAMVKNVFALRAKEGASTITQQLARNLYFTQEQTVSRKVREAWTALQIERTYTKNEILELYSNTVYYGRGAYGIRVASQVYFNKEPMKLTLSESAYLVGLFKAPERYANDDSLGVARRNLILGMMKDADYIAEDQWSKATAEPLARASSASTLRGIAPHFVEMVRQQLSVGSAKLKGFDLYRDGLIIHTTLNSQIQRYANEAVSEHLTQYQALFDKSWSWKGRSPLVNSIIERAVYKKPEYVAANSTKRKEILDRYRRNKAFVDSLKRDLTTIQTGLVVIDPRTGGILALVGASPQSMKMNPAARYSLNHVSQIRRQPGSSFKPFVYAAALEDGLSPETTIESGPFSTTLASGVVWAPRGASKAGGPMALRAALKFSVNTVAARLITEHTTPGRVIDVSQRLGITSPMQAVPSLALGSVEVSPLEMTSAYAAIANQGVAVQSVSITRVEDRMGNILYDARLPQNVNDAISPEVARNMISMMRGVVDGGTASSIRKFFKYDAAGKTGTTNDFADAWFVGFTPQLTAGVWVGFDDRRVMFQGDYGQGGRAAAPAWGRLMQKVYNDPQLGYRQTTFKVAKDSNDIADPALIKDPPRENIDDDTTTATPPVPPR